MTWREIVRLYRLTVAATPERNLPARYNICPTTTIDTIVERNGNARIGPYAVASRSWVVEKEGRRRQRRSTRVLKPSRRSPYSGMPSRSVVVFSGYYEWATTPGGEQPLYFTRRDGAPALSITGLWDEWKNIETNEPPKSCTMITTAANDFVREVHDRMPVLLSPEDFDRWLSQDSGAELLRPAENDYLQSYR